MSNQLTLLIKQWHAGDAAATEQLFQFAYLQLRHIAREERDKIDQKYGDQNLLQREEIYNTTSLIHEAYIKLESTDFSYIQNRRQFYSMVSKIIRQIIFAGARKSQALKRQSVSDNHYNDTLIENHGKTHLVTALEKFSLQYSRQSEVLQLRYFMGLSNQQICQVMQCSESLIEKDIKFGKSWIRKKMY